MNTFLIFREAIGFEAKICRGLGLISINEFQDKIKEVKKVLQKDGYEIRTEIIDDSDYGGDGALEIKSAYTPNGDYIGNLEMAKTLSKKGIAPQKKRPDCNICTIGFSMKDNKWYGWSHRAIYGFKPGDVITKDDLGSETFKPGYELKNLEDAKKAAIAFADSVR